MNQFAIWPSKNFVLALVLPGPVIGKSGRLDFKGSLRCLSSNFLVLVGLASLNIGKAYAATKIINLIQHVKIFVILVPVHIVSPIKQIHL